jgi:hypothetical protein
MHTWSVRLATPSSPYRSGINRWVWTVLLTLWIALDGMGSSIAPALEEASSSPSAPPVAVGQQRTLSGWFHVVWNGAPRYVLVDDQGQWIELLLDETLVRPFGGPLAFNRKRVRIEGESVHAPSGGVRVLSISFE